MEKDIKRVSITKFETALDKENIINETLVGTDDVVIEIKKTIPLNEMIVFVQEVVEACIDTETGEYTPEAYDFAFRVAVLTHYANFAMPSNLDKQYMLVYGTRAFDQITGNINVCQLSDITRAIDRKIQFMLDVISSSAVNKINEVINKFNDIATSSEQVFGGINPSELSKVVEGITKLNKMDEADVAKVILDAKSKDTEATETIAIVKK